MDPPVSNRISRVPLYSGITSRLFRLRIQDYHLLRWGFPARFRSPISCAFPVTLLPQSCLNNIGLGSSPFDRLYSGNNFCSLLLWVLRCFSSPRSPHALRVMSSPPARRVVPFGYLRIISYLPIPAAFRSLSRPSSPLRATGIHRLPFIRFISRMLLFPNSPLPDSKKIFSATSILKRTSTFLVTSFFSGHYSSPDFRASILSILSKFL